MKKQTILIVDDESVNISILVEILQEKYELLIATNGMTALEIVSSAQRLDLILLDVIMPGMDGYEVAYKIKYSKKSSQIPFIFLTAKSSAGDIAEGFSKGAVDYISKPFAKEELLARVQNHLQIAKLTNALNDSRSQLQEKIVELDNANNVLFENKYFLESILDYSAHAIIATDINGKITLFSKSAEYLLGYKSSEVVNKQTPSIFHDEKEVSQRATELSKELEEDIEVGFNVFVIKTNYGMKNTYDWTYITKTNQRIRVSVSVSALRDKDTNIIGYIGLVEDITQKEIDNKTMKDYLSLIDKNIITSSTDLDGNIIYVSDAFCKISGYTSQELIGKNHDILRHQDMQNRIYDDLWHSITQSKVWNGVIKNKKKDGSYYWVDSMISPRYDYAGKKIGYTSIRHDVTDKKKLEELSITDELTSLYNRRYFNQVLEKELRRLGRVGEEITFLMIDIDYFKTYNDTYGHDYGDNALIQVGRVLNDLTNRSSDYAFRLGGEEFGILFYEENAKKSIEYAELIRKSIESLKIEHSGSQVSKYITVSIGLIYEKVDQDLTAKLLYKQADDNLYKAKESGRNKIITNL